MKTFKNFLDEIFTKPSKFNKKIDKQKDGEPASYNYKSTVNGKKIVVKMLRIDERLIKNSWELYFSVDGETDVTGEGDGIAIFSTVLSVIEDFITSQDPKVIEFSIDPFEETREKLYDRMVKRFSAKVGYRFRKEISLYRLVRKGKKVSK
jgi:hypothetical protein